MYKLQPSCIGVRLLSLSPPVTCCPRTAEATRNGIETTVLGIVRARNCARLGLSMLNPHGMVSRDRVPLPQGPRFCPCRSRTAKEATLSGSIGRRACLGPQKMRGSNGELTSPTTYPPMPFRFTSVGVRPLIGWSSGTPFPLHAFQPLEHDH